MGLRQAYSLLTSLLLIISDRSSDAALVQAAIDIDGDNNDFLGMILNQIEAMSNTSHNKTKSLSTVPSELTTALLQLAPLIKIRGSISDPSRKFTISFVLQATTASDTSDPTEDDDSDDDDVEWDWRGSGGVFNPIVNTVEPYVLGAINLVFNGILSTLISNFLESTVMLGGDVRIA